MPTLVLASGSPRRRELLALMGFHFIVCPADVDECFSGSVPDAVRTLSCRKAEATLALHPGQFILAADTLVCLNGTALGKPQDAQDAARMLRALSGVWHEVYTGVCLMAYGHTDARVEKTRVHFKPLDEALIARYVQSGEPMDKAGAYGMQGMGGMLVDRIEGCPSNVIGLPMSVVYDMLTPYISMCEQKRT